MHEIVNTGIGLDTQDTVKQCYEWRRCNVNVRSWTVEYKQLLYILDLHLYGGINKSITRGK